jgi:hypothetical protein
MAEKQDSTPKLHDVTVRKKHYVVDYVRLVRRLEKIREIEKNEHHAQGYALFMLAEFLTANHATRPTTVSLWLMKMASSLTDPDGKSLPSNVWRKFALISLGMKALTMSGIGRKEAARQAHRAVKTIGNITTDTLLSRYNELQKDRVQNREARRIYSQQTQKLAKLIELKDPQAVAKHYFGLADMADDV